MDVFVRPDPAAAYNKKIQIAGFQIGNHKVILYSIGVYTRLKYSRGCPLCSEENRFLHVYTTDLNTSRGEVSAADTYIPTYYTHTHITYFECVHSADWSYNKHYIIIYAAIRLKSKHELLG